MADLGDMTLEKFKLWSSNALRVYLSLRKKPINGNFEELTARAFCAWDENLPVDLDAEQYQIRLLAEYKAKLSIDGLCVDDPLSVKSGWIGEKEGMMKWPAVYIMDISEYLNTKNSEHLMKRLMNEYKEGKAFRYFSGDWVKEILYHDIESSEYCMVKSKVTPSQAINNKAYEVWLILKKDSGDVPGGQVAQAYCSCTAGMLGSCNHIAGVLFRMEHAVKTGMTRPTCTSKTCEWTIPKKKTSIKPGKVADFLWKKSHYTKLPIDIEKENEKSTKKKSFTPLNKSQQTNLQDKNRTRTDLHSLLKNHIPDSCFSLNMDKRRINVSVEKATPLPSNLIELGKQVQKDGLSREERKELFLTKIEMNAEQLSLVNTATVTQSHSDEWKDHRRGRITAILFHRVCCRTKSLRKSTEEDATSVINAVMGTAQCIQTKAMKHGISSEPIAKRAYSAMMKTQHKQFNCEDSGMVIFKEKQFISASPDLLVKCKCCGEGLCEIKCPESVKDRKPSPDNIPYLIILKDKSVSLKKNHPYFYQIQGQMGITGRQYCDFFVFTFHGHMCIRIPFDKIFFLEIIKDLSWFWEKFVIDKLLNSEEKTDGKRHADESVKK